MSKLYDFSCIMFQDSPVPIYRNYYGFASLKEAVQNRWADKSGSYFLISSSDAEDQGFDQCGIKWVKVSDWSTGAIIELFVAHAVIEHVHGFVNLGDGYVCRCGAKDTEPGL